MMWDHGVDPDPAGSHRDRDEDLAPNLIRICDRISPLKELQGVAIHAWERRWEVGGRWETRIGGGSGGVENPQSQLGLRSFLLWDPQSACRTLEHRNTEISKQNWLNAREKTTAVRDSGEYL